MRNFMMCSVIVIAVICSMAVGYAEKGINNLLPSVSKGKYDARELVSSEKLPYLPIPSSNEDYAFIQSIGPVTNVVLGQFKSGDREIVLITDRNSDGKVDAASMYSVDNKFIKRLDISQKEYSEENFKKMKTEIINGTRGELSPNVEGSLYLEKLISEKSKVIKITKYKKGYMLYINDPDEGNTNRAKFYFADNANGGGDLAFEVNYINVGKQRIRPVISYSVYSNNSSDPVVIDKVKELLVMMKK
ncbi:MAG TPA: hypothetical protein VF857_07225 [Spirochaetota bacterium]